MIVSGTVTSRTTGPAAAGVDLAASSSSRWRPPTFGCAPARRRGAAGDVAAQLERAAARRLFLERGGAASSWSVALLARLGGRPMQRAFGRPPWPRRGRRRLAAFAASARPSRRPPPPRASFARLAPRLPRSCFLAFVCCRFAAPAPCALLPARGDLLLATAPIDDCAARRLASCRLGGLGDRLGDRLGLGAATGSTTAAPRRPALPRRTGLLGRAARPRSRRASRRRASCAPRPGSCAPCRSSRRP